jgi:hypothetical protein
LISADDAEAWVRAFHAVQDVRFAAQAAAEGMRATWSILRGSTTSIAASCSKPCARHGHCSRG